MRLWIYTTEVSDFAAFCQYLACLCINLIISPFRESPEWPIEVEAPRIALASGGYRTTFVTCQRSQTLATSYSLKPWYPAKARLRLTGNPEQPARTQTCTPLA